MSDTYKMLAEFAQTWGMLYFLAVFICTMLYAFWPSLKGKFDDYARMPLRED